MTRILLMLAVVAGLAACSTAQGFVDDAEDVGDALTTP